MICKGDFYAICDTFLWDYILLSSMSICVIYLYNYPMEQWDEYRWNYMHDCTENEYF